MNNLVAGHDFDSLDRCETCPRTWFQIMHVTADQIGEEGVAHTGRLTSLEYASIDDRRTRERSWVWAVTLGVATGSGGAVVARPSDD